MKIFFAFFATLMALPVLWPECDLVMSGWFYHAGSGFFLADTVFFIALHWLANDGSRLLAAGFVLCGVIAFIRKQECSGLNAKAWLFLLLALLIGPGLIANAGLKDHWGRARPREVTAFGGAQPFTPALEPHFEHARSNGSFVAGDAAFGFFLTAFALVVPRRNTRQTFWATLAAGCCFGVARIVMGAHFFSDVIYAAFFMLVSNSALHAAMYGWRETKETWASWLFRVSEGKEGNSPAPRGRGAGGGGL